MKLRESIIISYVKMFKKVLKNVHKDVILNSYVERLFENVNPYGKLK